MFHAEDSELAEAKAARWNAVDEGGKGGVRAALLQSLLDPEQPIRHTAAQVAPLAAPLAAKSWAWLVLTPLSSLSLCAWRAGRCQVIASVAAVDLPNRQWGGPSGLIPMILQCVTAGAAVPEGSKQAALEALG